MLEVSQKQQGISTNTIALVIILDASALALISLWIGYHNETVQTAVILCITNLVSALTGLAGGILVGKASVMDTKATATGPGGAASSINSPASEPITPS